MYQIACKKMQLFNKPMFLSIYEQITHINKVKEYNKLILKKKTTQKFGLKYQYLNQIFHHYFISKYIDNMNNRLMEKLLQSNIVRSN